MTFVTFNFDNVIEDRLLAAVNDLYAFHRDDLQAVLQRDLPVLHVHGQLPPMPTLNQEWLELAAKSVKVILDELDMTVVEAAKRALSEAEVICFLGFAYSTENLEALDVPSVFGSSSQAIYGSALDLKDGEQIRVKRYFNQRIELAKEAFDSKAVLRQYDVIRPSTTRRQNRSSQ